MLWLDSTPNIPLAVALIRRTTEDQVYDWAADKYVTLPPVLVWKQHYQIAVPFGPGTPCAGTYTLSTPPNSSVPDGAVTVWSCDLAGTLFQRLTTQANGGGSGNVWVRVSGG